jgi:hypothetical protein
MKPNELDGRVCRKNRYTRNKDRARPMKPNELAGRVFRKNTKRTFSVLSGHSVTIELEQWSVGEDEVSLDADDYPYLRMAVIDMYLERQIV